MRRKVASSIALVGSVQIAPVMPHMGEKGNQRNTATTPFLSQVYPDLGRPFHRNAIGRAVATVWPGMRTIFGRFWQCESIPGRMSCGFGGAHLFARGLGGRCDGSLRNSNGLRCGSRAAGRSRGLRVCRCGGRPGGLGGGRVNAAGRTGVGGRSHGAGVAGTVCQFAQATACRGRSIAQNESGRAGTVRVGDRRRSAGGLWASDALFS